MATVLLDADKTRQALIASIARISWSKIQQYERCPGNWLIENYAVLAERTDHIDDSLHAVPGTLVQRIWESIINDRIYRREGLGDRQAVASWANQQLTALFACIVRPLEEQYRLGKEQRRRYFASDEGKAELSALADAHGLERCMRHHLQPKFVRFDQLFKLHGGRDAFLEKLAGTFVPTLAALDAAQLDLDGMLAEIFVVARNGEDELAGGIDFVWNRHRSARGYFDDLSLLEDGYIMLDGKMQLGATVDVGQLRFYATMLLLNYGKRPAALGFLSYRPAKLLAREFRDQMTEEMLGRIARYRQGITGVLDSLNLINTEDGTIALDKLPGLTLTPNKLACRFCGVSAACSASMGRLRANQL